MNAYNYTEVPNDLKEPPNLRLKQILKLQPY